MEPPAEPSTELRRKSKQRSDEIYYPPGFESATSLAYGTTGQILLDRSNNTVVKSPHEVGDPRTEIERRIYERLRSAGGHPGLPRYHGPYDEGIRLDCIPMVLTGYLERYKSNLLGHDIKNFDLSWKQKLRWMKQLAAVLGFVHAQDVIHSDLCANNLMLDEDLNIKLVDFAGSSIDGSEPFVVVQTSNEHPVEEICMSTKGDIFAMGSVFYQIMTEGVPYSGLDDDEIIRRYQREEFPDVLSLGPVGKVIWRCWHCHYDNATLVLSDLEAIPESSWPRPWRAMHFTSALPLAAYSVPILALTGFGTIILTYSLVRTLLARQCRR